MSPIEFANYQRQLNAQREQFINDRKKLAPKVLLGDDDFDASIGDIPLAISLPFQEMKKSQKHKTTNPKNNPLF